MAIQSRSTKEQGSKGNGKSWRHVVGTFGPFVVSFAPAYKKVKVDGKDTFAPTGEMAMKLEILDGAGKSYFPKVEIGFSSSGQGGLAQVIEHLAEFGEAVEMAGASWGDDATYAAAMTGMQAWLKDNGTKPAPTAPLASKIKSREAVAAVNAA